MKNLKNLFLVLTMVGVLALNTVSVFAHGLHHDNEGTVFSVKYDDGSPVKNAVVLVYDEAGEQIHEGKTDDNGAFDYGQIDGAAKILANDGNGHQAEYEMETPVVVADTETEKSETEEVEKEEANEESDKEVSTDEEVDSAQDNSKMMTVVIVLVTLGAIAGVFYMRNKKVTK